MSETESTKQKVIVGGTVGAGIVAVAPAATVLAVNAAGFTAGGIAAGSMAASAMSAAAVANGGAIAAGSSIAVLQSIGTVGLGTALGVGAIAAVPVIAGTAALVYGLNKVISAMRPTSANIVGKWLVATMSTEEDGDNVKMNYFESEKEARNFFESQIEARVLYNPIGLVVQTAESNSNVIETIKKFVAERRVAVMAETQENNKKTV
jgi:hypothetical protein